MAMDVSAKPVWAGIFQSMGAQFVTPPDQLRKKLIRIRALICDWDGTFSEGEKGDGVTRHFTEPDFMGSSLLRFGLWLPQKSRLSLSSPMSTTGRQCFLIPFRGF